MMRMALGMGKPTLNELLAEYYRRAAGVMPPADFPRFPCRDSAQCRMSPWLLLPAT
jgi:hypothetical protein